MQSQTNELEHEPRPGDPGGGLESNSFQIVDRRRKRKNTETHENNTNREMRKNNDEKRKKYDEQKASQKNDEINKTYAEMLMINTNNDKKKKKKVVSINKFRKLIAERPIERNSKIKPKHRKVNNHFVPMKKQVKHGISFNMSPKDRWEIFDKYKGKRLKVFRHEVRKWTPMEEINKLLQVKLNNLICVWDKPKVSSNEASKTWLNARKHIIVAGLVMKSYDSRKFDEDGTRIDNVLRIQQAIKRTSNFQTKLRNDLKLIGNKKAEYRIRKIIQRNKRKFSNAEQILHFNDQRMTILGDRLKLTKDKCEFYRVNKAFEIKPSLRVLDPKKKYVVDIPNKQVHEYLNEFYKKSECSEPKILSEWLEHMNNRNVNETEKCTFNDEVFEETIRYAQNWKCPGENRIPIFLIKKLPIVKQFIKKWIIGVIEERVPITMFDVRGEAYAIFKAGDVSLGKNYRYVNALNSHYKLLMKYLNKEVRRWCGTIIKTNQFAGRPGFDGALDIGITNRVLQEMGELSQGWYDMQKAYDSVNHTRLKMIINSIKEIPKTIRNILCKLPSLYQFSVVNCSDDKDENGKVVKKKKKPWIKLHRGIYQGCALAPWLFCLCLAPLQWKIRKDAKQIDLYGENKADILIFMDDIKGFGETKEDLQKITNLIKNYGLEIGLTINQDKTEFSYPDDEKIIQYKYMGIYESHKSACDEINIEQLLNKLDDKLNKIFNSRLNVKNTIKAINGCVLPTCTYMFSHEFSQEERIGMAKMVDQRIRNYMNVKGLKLATISNARCYLPRNKLGLGLQSAEEEMDKTTLKNFIHMVLSPHLKFAVKHDANKGALWRDRALMVARKYGIDFQIDVDNTKIKINGVEYNHLMLKDAKIKAKELIANFAEKRWEEHYRRKKMFPKLAGEMELECPWLLKGNVFPELFKKASIYQDNACIQINSPGNVESQCIHCGKEDHSNHLMSQCLNEEMVKKRKFRHDRVLATIVNSISYEKTNKFINTKDLRKVHELKDLKVAVDQVNYIADETIHHSRPDLIIEKEKEIIVAEVSVVTPLHLLSAKKLKEQRYTINGQNEILVPSDNLEPGPNYCTYLSKHVNKQIIFVPLIIGTMGELDGINNGCWKQFTKLTGISSEVIWRASKEAAQQSIYIIDQYIKEKNKQAN